jgi:multidrug efflux pump subunit AcrB
MIVTNYAIRSRTTVYVVAAAMVVFGIFSYYSLPREAAPDITIPYIVVNTSYSGVSPSDMETSVTLEIEKKLKGMSDVKEIRSVSSEGFSSITVEFEPDIDIDTALQKVRDKVDQARGEIPQEADEPTVTEINISEFPIMLVNITGDVGVVRLKEIADDLQDDIEAVRGVLAANIIGALEREIRVEVDPDRLAQYQIPVLQLISLISQENVNVSGGSVETPGAKFAVRVPAEFDDPREIETLVVMERDGRPIYLTDVARITDTFKDRLSYSRLNGREAVSLSIQKRAGENVIRIADEIKAILAEWHKRLPPGVSIEVSFDESKDIRTMVEDLENNIISGFILVAGVIFLSMGWRNAIFVSIAIPLSMLITFFAIDALAITLNFVTLFALIMALGMLVDNAIVIVENIYRHMQEGHTRIEAAKLGAAQVAWPVTTSTITTVVAFMPLLFWPGIVGEFMGFLPKTVIIALMASLFVGLVVNPAICSKYMRLSAKDRASIEERRGGRFMGGYEAFLRASLRYRWTTLVVMVVLLVVVTLSYRRYGAGVQFFPEADPNRAFVNIKAPEGASLDKVNALGLEIERRVMPLRSVRAATLEAGEDAASAQLALTIDATEPALRAAALARAAAAAGSVRGVTAEAGGASGGAEGVRLEAPGAAPDGARALFEEARRRVVAVANIERIVSNVGAGSGGNIFGGGTSENVNTARISMDFLAFSDRLESSMASTETIRHMLSDMPGAEITVEKEEHGPPVGAPVSIEVSGEDFETLAVLAQDIQRRIRTVPGLVDLKDDYEQARPELQFAVDRSRAKLLGFDTNTVAFFLKTAVLGTKVSTFRQGNDEYDITVRLPLEDRDEPEKILRLYVPTLTGQMVPLSSLARFEYSGGLGSINRVDQRRVITVLGDNEGRLPREILADVQERLKSMPLPAGYYINYAGEDEEMIEAQTFLMRAFIAALFLVAAVIVAEFNSVMTTLIIMASVIFSLIGVFSGLLITHTPFGVIMTGIGVISLAGVVVNNAIVLLEYVEIVRGEGVDRDQALVRAGITRLRPVLLTAVTTVLGLVPMAIGVSYDFVNLRWVLASESSQWWGQMAVAVIFGLVFATVLTLVVVPTMYSVLDSVKSLLGHPWRARGQSPE